jgi:hypothetical protein
MIYIVLRKVYSRHDVVSPLLLKIEHARQQSESCLLQNFGLLHNFVRMVGTRKNVTRRCRTLGLLDASMTDDVPNLVDFFDFQIESTAAAWFVAFYGCALPWNVTTRPNYNFSCLGNGFIYHLVAFGPRTNLSRNSCPGTPSPLHPTRSHHDLIVYTDFSNHHTPY